MKTLHAGPHFNVFNTVLTHTVRRGPRGGWRLRPQRRSKRLRFLRIWGGVGGTYASGVFKSVHNSGVWISVPQRVWISSFTRIPHTYLLISPGPSMMKMKGMIMGRAAMEMQAKRLTSSMKAEGSPPSRES